VDLRKAGFRICEASYTPREVLWEGRKYIAVPTVLLTEGVHNGLYYPAEELAKFPEAWNGVPVPIHHPEQDGVPVSCNDPKVIADRVVGRLWNVRFEDNKLRGEIWVDVEKANEIDPSLVAALLSRAQMDVSTGLYCDEEYSPGVWNDEEFVAIARNYRPDHLALLPGAVGACSWEDGCGVRANQNKKKGGKMNVRTNIRSTARDPAYSGTETISWADVDKTMAAYISGYYKHTGADKPDEEVTSVGAMPSEMKSWIASKSLLGDANAETFAELVFFPVVNPDTDKLNEGALRSVISGRGAQADIPDTAKESAQNKARSLLDKEFGTDLSTQQQLGGVKRLVQALARCLGIQANETELSHDDLRGQLQRIVDGLDEPPRQTEGVYNYIEEVFDSYFIFREVRPGESDRLFKQDYEVVDGEVNIKGQPKEVSLKTEYVELEQVPASPEDNNDKGKEGNEDMKEVTKDRKDKVEALIANEQVTFCEADREFLEGMPDEQFEKIEALAQAALDKEEPPVQGGEPPAKGDDGAKEDVQTNDDVTKSGQDEDTDAPKTPEEYLANAKEMPQEMREMFINGLKLHREQRAKFIKAIMANERNVFTEEQLKAKNMEELKALAALAQPEGTFELNAGDDRFHTNDQDDQGMAPPPPRPKWTPDGKPDFSELN